MLNIHNLFFCFFFFYFFSVGFDHKVQLKSAIIICILAFLLENLWLLFLKLLKTSFYLIHQILLCWICRYFFYGVLSASSSESGMTFFYSYFRQFRKVSLPLEFEFQFIRHLIVFLCFLLYGRSLSFDTMAFWFLLIVFERPVLLILVYRS